VQTTPDAVIAHNHQVTDSQHARFPEIATMLEGARADLTGFPAPPREHWQNVWSNNAIKHRGR
jgi:transposase-like protein